LLCSLDPGATRTLSQFVNNDTVQLRCRGQGGTFVETACCSEEIDELTFATGCPRQAKFNTASGADKRCIEDQPDASENVQGELVVATVCCQELCDPQAAWDDPATRDVCRNAAGQFHPHVCCMMSDEQRCGDAQFDVDLDENGFRFCLAQSGPLAGQYAPAACCVDACFDILTEQTQEIPIECLLPLDGECNDASVDGDGLCRVADGAFAKGACCLGLDGVAFPQSDRCWLGQVLGEDLQAAGCPDL
jgi:hypothetical protein